MMEGVMDLNHVNEAIVKNYRHLRTRLGIVAVAFPLVLLAMGYLKGIEVQPTMSNYYFAKDTALGRLDVYPVRLWFCGILFVVGFFLYKYQGFSKNEDRWLSVAGIFAACVAIFPMSVGNANDYAWVLAWTGLTTLSLHGICAVLAFASIAVVIVWYADSTLSELKHQHPVAYKRFKRAYFLIALFMVLAIGLAVALHYLHHERGSYILAAEWAGIWAFGAYWFVKNWEVGMVGDAIREKRAKALAPMEPRMDIVDAL
jgi:hypothetical protein